MADIAANHIKDFYGYYQIFELVAFPPHSNLANFVLKEVSGILQNLPGSADQVCQYIESHSLASRPKNCNDFVDEIVFEHAKNYPNVHLEEIEHQWLLSGLNSLKL